MIFKKYNRRNFKIYSALIIFNFATSQLGLAQSGLKVFKIEGEVIKTLSDKKTSVEAKTGDEINEGEQLTIKKNSRALIGDTHSQFWAGQNTEFSLSKGELLPEQKDTKKIISLIKGNLRVKIKSGEGSRFQVRSKSAVAGVRGTEFFFSNDQENITFCVLEGKAWLKDEKSGEQFDVNEGAGIVLGANGKIAKTFTSEQVKYDWIAMTEFKDDKRLTGSFYAQDPLPQQLNKRWSYRYNLLGLIRTYENRDYDYNTIDKSDNMYHTAFAPSLIYDSGKFNFQFTPRFLHIKSDNRLQWDDIPLTRENGANYFFIQDVYAQYSHENWSLKVGLFPIVWKENALMQERPWMPDTIAQRGGLLTYDLPLSKTNLKIEALATKGVEVDELDPLDGRTNISINALRFTEAKDRATLTLLNRNSGDFTTTVGATNYRTGTDTKEAILSLRDTEKYFDYNFTTGFQTTKAFKNSSTLAEKDVSGKSMDGLIGIPLPNQFRAQFRYVYADPNYVPGVEDYYEMGFIGRFFHTNIKQQRVMLEKAFKDIHRVRLEFLSSRKAGDSAFKTNTVSTKPKPAGVVLAEEMDLVWLANWTKSVQTFVSLWYFETGLYLRNTDPAWGANLGIRITQ